MIDAGVEENELTIVEINNLGQDIPNTSSGIILRQNNKELTEGNDYPLGNTGTSDESFVFPK